MVGNVQCPVCTLFLHAGMNLSDHLETHPKEQVIKALVQLTISGGTVGGGLAKSLLAASVAISGDERDKKPQIVVSAVIGAAAATSSAAVGSGGERNHLATTVDKENDVSCNSSNSNSALSSVTSVGSYGGSSVGLSFANTFSSSSASSTSSSSSLSSSSNVGAISGPSPHKPSALASPALSAASPTTSQSAVDKIGFQQQHQQQQTSTFGSQQQPQQQQQQQQQQTYPQHHQTNESNRKFDLIGSQQQPQHQRYGSTPTASTVSAVPLLQSNASQLPQHQQPTSAYGLHQQHQSPQLLSVMPSTPNSHTMPHPQQQSYNSRTTLLPPPPPPPSAIASSSAQEHQQQQQNQQQMHAQKHQTHTLLQHHHHQQQQQQQQQPQNLKIMYSSGLPPPPPLQMFTYQAPPQPQHQKPPPAYGTAISQIRSQHNQNKQLPPQQSHVALGTHLKHHASAMPLQQQHQPQHMRLPSQQQQLTLASVPPPPSSSTAASLPPPPPPQPPTTTTTTSTSKQLQYTTKPPPTEFQTAPPTTTSRTPLTATSTITFTTSATTSSAVVHSQRLVNEQDASPSSSSSSSKKSLPLTPRATQPTSSNCANASATAAKASSSSFAIVLAAAPSPSSSVLRYAESPVAHYLERDNGDFIVQETPKHIVECVEKEDGEFSVIERIYQSPPSVLHIHDDDDVDDDNEGGVDACEDQRDEKVKMKESSSADVSARTSNAGDSDLVVNDDDEEFMSIQGDSDMDDLDEEPVKGGATSKKQSSTAMVNTERCLQSGSSSGSNSISEPYEASSIASGSDNSDVKPSSLCSSTSSKKKSSKNTITVLSDVQLNLNEYLDLVGNIMASKRTFPATAPIPLVKVEKIEPSDEDDEYVHVKGTTGASAGRKQKKRHAKEQPEGDDNDVSADIDIDEDSEFIMEIGEETTVATTVEVVSETTESLKNANTNETDELVENNRSNNKTSLQQQQQQQQQQQKQPHITNHKEDIANSNTNNIDKHQAPSIAAAATCSSQVTSVIRMAAAVSQPQQTRDGECLSTATPKIDEDTKQSLPNDVVVAEDLSQRSAAHHSTATMPATLPPPLLKKGPKKLIIKPKSTKTDATASGTSLPMPDVSKKTASSSSTLTVDAQRHYTDELPTTSAMAAAQQRLKKDAATPMVYIKTEPHSMASYERPPANMERSGSILEKQLKLGPQQKQSTTVGAVETMSPPKLKMEKVDESSAGRHKLLKASTTSADDARVLLDFANSSKRSAQPATINTAADVSANFLSNGSIFSKSTVDDAALSQPNSSCSNSSIGRTTSPSSELRCDDEFIPNDPADAVQEVVISSSFTTESVSKSVSGVGNSEHRLQQPPRVDSQQQHGQPQHHQHQQQQQHSFAEYPFSFFYGGAGGIETKGNFSPLYYQQAHDATNAATVASSGSSVANSTDDSASGSHQQHHHQQQQQQQHLQHPQQQHHLAGHTLQTNSQQHHNHQQQHQHHNQHQQPQQKQQHQLNRVQEHDQQWYLNHATSAPNADFETALAVNYTTSADGSEVVSKYLDLDTCKRESIGIGMPPLPGGSGITGAIGATTSTTTTVPQPPPPSSSTSSSFTAATESGCTTDALSIRTDEKMPAKGEISEQESNCDIENSWSQPMYSDISARFFKTSFPGIFQHENGWNQDEYFTVQDLSAATTTPANGAGNVSGSGAKQTKSFDFRLPLEASTSSAAMAGGAPNNGLTMFSQHGGADHLMPSTSSTAKKKRKSAASKTVAGRQLTSTITSAQMLQQQQPQPHLPPHQQFHPYSMMPQPLGFGDPSTSAALLAGPSSAAPGSSAPSQAKPIRKKIYQCAHCTLEFSKLKERNTHMIEMHNYVRRNRRLICSQPEPSSSTANASSAQLGAVASSGSTLSQKPTDNIDQRNLVEDSKQGIVKVEPNTDASSNSEHVGGMSTMALNAAQTAITTKSEYPDESEHSLALMGSTGTTAAANEAIDTKPRIQLPSATPSSKLATLYRMLVSYNISTMKQNLNITECEEKLIETSIFFCYVCRTNFNSVKMYDAHLTEHPAECFTCGKKFQRWKNFSLHLKRHLGWKEFGCNVCDKKFVVRSALVEHMRMHTGVTPLKCKFCGKHFKRYSNLTQHRKRHIKKEYVRKKEYVCHCGEVLPSKARFLWHKETHDSKPKCCPHCCDRFVHANSLRRHIRLAHSDKFDYTEPMECPMCKQIFAKSSIKAHMATHSVDTQFDCAICNKSFSTKWNLKIHSWVHANRTSKPFKCEHCPKAFVREVDFKNHINAHKQIKPYTCEYCGCKFIRKYNYMRHRREHHGNKKFTCDLCKKSFHRHYYLIEHRRIHTGERPFQCTICGKSSTTKTNHNKHLKIHHSRDPFTVEA